MDDKLWEKWYNAVMDGKKRKIKRINPGEDIDLPLSFGYTALMIAVLRRYWDIVPLLLAKGADTEVKDWDGHTAQMIAVKWGCTKMAQLIENYKEQKQNGHMMDERLLKRWYRAMDKWFRAARNNDIDQLKRFIDAGIKIDLRDSFRYNDTALILAAERGYAAIVKLLLEKGANPDLQNKFGRTALTCAVRHKYTEIVQLLLEKGANPDLPDENGITARREAFFKEEIAQLIEKYQNQQKIDKERKTIIKKEEDVFNKLKTIAEDKKDEKHEQIANDVINQYKEDEASKNKSNEDEADPNNN